MPRSIPACLQRALRVASVATVALACSLGSTVLTVPGAHAAPVTANNLSSTLPATPAGLDKTGSVLPRTDYPIPSGAIFMSTSGSDANSGTLKSPVKSLNQAVKLAPDNGTIVLRSGEYRDWYHNKDASSYGIVTKSLTFQAYPGERPWFNGTNKLKSTRWTKTAGRNLWSMSWKTPNFCDGQYYSRPLADQQEKPNNGPCAHFDMSKDPSNPMAVDPQMLFVDNLGLRQVTSLSQVSAKTFFYDWKAKRLYLGVAPEGRKVEASVRPMAMVLSNKGNGFRILGIGFRKFATNEFHNLTNAVIYVGGSKLMLENSVFTENAAGAVSFSNPRPGSVVRSTVFARNGYVALGGNGTAPSGQRNDLVVDGNVFYRNNAEKFGTGCSISCGQAAAKFAHMLGLTLSSNLVEETGGNGGGLWCDLGCRDTKIVYNTVRANPGAGIFYEVSSEGIIAGNVVTGSQYGIAVASATTKVYNNTLADNTQGINVYDDSRTLGRDGWDDIGPDTRDVEVVNNVVSGNNYSLLASSAKVKAAPPNTGAEDVFSRVDYNAFYQSNGARPVFVYWRTLAGQQTLFRSRITFNDHSGFEKSGDWLTGPQQPLFEG
ncbi:MAG TPA: right-handed parallel beta-helix repeat-containing protein, partial [Propionibacteriaceae bacterium]